MESFNNASAGRPKKVQHGFQPVYYFSRFIGLWPFTIAHNSNGSKKEARVHLIDGFWFLISICLYLTAIFYIYKRIMDLRTSDDNPYVLVNSITNTVLLLFRAVSIVLDLFNRNSLVNILDKFIIFDSGEGLIFFS